MKFSIFGLVCVLFVLAASIASCSSDNTSTPDASMPMPDATPPAACPSGYSLCGADCVPIKRDPLNCGACGKACKPGEVCVQGGCALQCGGSTVKCGALCVNSKSDPDNCGMCAIKCSPGQVCNVGKCDVSCQQGLANCSNACVDLQTDDDNCGMCGNSCDPGQKCSGGKCVATCQQGWTSCPTDGGTTCANLVTDNSNCGSCGTQCPNGQFCSPGADGGMSTCGLGCFGGTTKCGNACVDLQIDPQNCGACGTPCNGTCFNGMCCSGNQVWCNGACRDWKTDKNNCGGCGIVCGGFCNQGICCGPNDILCNGQCTNIKTDSKNCNGCGNVCPQNTPVCANGSCTACNLVGTLGNQNFCKVQVSGTMTDTNVRAACLNAGLNVGCQAKGNCTYNDNLCVMTNEASCSFPMQTLAQSLGCNSPAVCNGVFEGVYQYMGQNWLNGASCGVENQGWCSIGSNYSNRWALCVQ